MELPGYDVTMLPSGSEDILLPGDGTHLLLHRLRESQVRLCPLGRLRSVPMVLLLKVATMRLASSDAWDLAHFGVLIYRNEKKYTKRRKTVKSLDGNLIVTIDSQVLWSPIDDLDTFSAGALGIVDTVAELLHPTVWRAQSIVAGHAQLIKLYIALDSSVTIWKMARLFSLCIKEYAEEVRDVIRGHQTQAPTSQRYRRPCR